MKLEPLQASQLPAELWRQLATALEYEGWQEAETLYAQVHAALSGAATAARARALMDHARVLRRVEREADAAAREAEAEALLGQAISRDEEAKSSVDELTQNAKPAKGLKGLFKKMLGGG